MSEIAVSNLVLAYNEATGETDYYTATALISHVDPSIIERTIDGAPSCPTAAALSAIGANLARPLLGRA